MGKKGIPKKEKKLNTSSPKASRNRALVRGGDRGDKSPPEFFETEVKFHPKALKLPILAMDPGLSPPGMKFLTKVLITV